MAGLLSRLGKATGDALQTYAGETLKDARSSLDQKRLERLEKIKQGYALERVKRQGEIQIEAATTLHGRGLEDIERQGELSAESAAAEGISQSARDERLHQYKKTEKTFGLEEKARIEGGGASALAEEGRIKQLSETIFDDAYADNILPFDKKGFKLDRWKGSKARAKADIRDRLKSGWTESQVYDYLVDNKLPEPPTSKKLDISLDLIMKEQLERPGVTEKDVLNQVLNEPRLSQFHAEARSLLDDQ